MSDKEYIVSEEQITSAVESALKEHVTNNTIIRELMTSVENNISTVLEDDCDEFVWEDWDYIG